MSIYILLFPLDSKNYGKHLPVQVGTEPLHLPPCVQTRTRDIPLLIS